MPLSSLVMSLQTLQTTLDTIATKSAPSAATAIQDTTQAAAYSQEQIQSLTDAAIKSSTELKNLANDPEFGGYLDQLTELFQAAADPANKNNPFAQFDVENASRNLEALLRKADPFFNEDNFRRLVQKAMQDAAKAQQQQASTITPAAAPASPATATASLSGGGLVFRVVSKNGVPVIDVLADSGGSSHPDLLGHSAADYQKMLSSGLLSGRW